MNQNYSDSQKIMWETKAHQTRDIRYLLIPFFCFKLSIRFKPSPEYKGNTGSLTFYGHEHSCSYKQCIAGHVKDILLDRMKGYNELIKKVELEYKGKYTSAKIYGRSPGELMFPTLHRTYYNGKLDKESVVDPVIDLKDEFKTLYYRLESNLLILSEVYPYK